MEFQILGPLRVVGSDGTIELNAALERALLLRLVVDANRPVAAERLIDDLWEQRPPPSATRTLRVYVSRLRKALGEPARIETTAGGYRLCLEPGECDASRFEALISQGRFTEGLALWRGPALTDVAGAQWAQIETSRLEQGRLSALERRLKFDLDAGRHEEVVGELETLCAREPLREGLWASLMLALYRSGRQADALAAFARMRKHLVSELGIEPQPALRDLQSRILAGDSKLDLSAPTTAAPTAGVGSAPDAPGRGNIAVPRNTFVAGSLDLAALRELLLETRGPLTLTGPPGAGKTRLALELAVAAQHDFPGGAWLVELAPAADGALLPTRIVDAMGLEGAPGSDPFELLSSRFIADPGLLVLDNCEHLTRACAEVVARLEADGTRLTVLTTSRERLGCDGEVVHRVPPLPLPDTRANTDTITSAPACRLFLDRAMAAGGSVELERPDAARALAEICRRLDGLPLALELAAARTSVLSIVDIAARLDDALGLLQSRRVQVPERQRTLRALIHWSDSLLDHPERALLRRLSVFTGGASLDAVEHVCAAAPLSRSACVDALQSLAERSLIVVDTSGERARYRLLETIRLYAQEQLRDAAEEPELRDAHARWCAELVAEAQQLWENGRQVDGFEVVAREQDNWRSALSWLIASGDGTGATQLAARLGEWWYVNGRTVEGRAALDAVLALAAPPTRDRAIVLRYAGALARMNGDIPAAIRHIKDGIAVAGAVGDHTVLLQLQISLGAATWLGGDTDEARATLRDALDTARSLGDRRAEGSISYNLAVLARNAGDLGAALDGIEAARTAWLEFGDQRGVALTSGLAASIHLRRGDRSEARDQVQEALGMFRGTAYTEAIVEQLETVVVLDSLDQEFTRAARLLGFADATRRAEQLMRPPVDDADLERTRAHIREQLGGEADVEIVAGAQISLDDAIALALEDPECASALSGRHKRRA